MTYAIKLATFGSYINICGNSHAKHDKLSELKYLFRNLHYLVFRLNSEQVPFLFRSHVLVTVIFLWSRLHANRVSVLLRL